MKLFPPVVYSLVLISQGHLAACFLPPQKCRSIRYLDRAFGGKPSDDEFCSSSDFADIVRGGQAELLLSKPTLASYFEKLPQEDADDTRELLQLAEQCRRCYLTTGMAHIPHFVRGEIVEQMVQEALCLQQQKDCFYSTETHTVYQEAPDLKLFAKDHPRNALQHSSKWIMDYNRIVTNQPSSPLHVLYASPALKAFVSYVVRPDTNSSSTQQVAAELYTSGCEYNAAYYNIYQANDGLGWHFDKSDFGVNLELQPAKDGGNFELCRNTLDNDKVQTILDQSTPTDCHFAQRIHHPHVGPGSLVIFAGSRNLHRVTPVKGRHQPPRINAIMTYETQPNQKPNAYSLKKFFGRG